MANPFMIDPTMGRGTGLQGLANVLRENRQRKELQAAEAAKAEQKAALDARFGEVLRSGDPMAMAEFAGVNPQYSDAIKQQYGITNKKTEDVVRDMSSALMGIDDPMRAADIMQQGSQQIEQLNGNPAFTLASIDKLRQGGPEAMQELAMVKSIAGGMFPDAVKSGPTIGQYNPRDYTVSSFAEFRKSGDPSVLERYAPSRPVMIAGVPHNYNPVSGEYEAVQSAEKVAEAAATIAAETTKATSKAKALVEKDEAQAGQGAKLEQADKVYNDLKGADLDKIYGFGEELYPELLRSEEGRGLMAKRDQLLGMLKLAARGELKGQGPITEGEQGILSQSVSILDNQGISPETARDALDDAMSILYRNAGEKFKPSDADPGIPSVVSTQADYDALPSGAIFIEDGVQYRKP